MVCSLVYACPTISRNNLITRSMKNESPAYKILAFIRENYDKNELDILEEFIQEEFPEDWNRFESDNYDGPDEPDYDGPSNAERQERMAAYQRLK